MCSLRQRFSRRAPAAHAGIHSACIAKGTQVQAIAAASGAAVIATQACIAAFATANGWYHRVAALAVGGASASCSLAACALAAAVASICTVLIPAHCLHCSLLKAAGNA